MERMNEVEEMLREMSEKYKNSKSVEVYEEQLEGWFKIIDDLREENKNLKEELKWWKDLVHKAKEFEYDEDGMDYIWQNTKI